MKYTVQAVEENLPVDCTRVCPFEFRQSAERAKEQIEEGDTGFMWWNAAEARAAAKEDEYCFYWVVETPDDGDDQ